MSARRFFLGCVKFWDSSELLSEMTSSLFHVDASDVARDDDLADAARKSRF